jgi:hypothetical protein
MIRLLLAVVNVADIRAPMRRLRRGGVDAFRPSLSKNPVGGASAAYRLKLSGFWPNEMRRLPPLGVAKSPLERQG